MAQGEGFRPLNLDNQRAQMRQMIAGAIVGNMLQH